MPEPEKVTVEIFDLLASLPDDFLVERDDTPAQEIEVFN